MKPKRIEKKRIIIVIAYIIALVFFVVRVERNRNTFNQFPDEKAHIAYIAYLEKNNAIIPEFENMRLLNEFTKDPEEVTHFSENEVNHLGHPPLYYQIMKLFHLVTVEGEAVTYNLKGLRLVSLGITLLALILAMYIGYTRIQGILANIVYAFTLVSIPLMTYIGGAVQNDVLTFLGINVFLLGIIRISENRKKQLTYFLIAIGVAICTLTKLTAGLIVLLASVIMCIYLYKKEKSLKFLFCKQFVITLPIYFLILGYYIFMINQYGTINPSLPVIAPDYFKTTSFYVPEIGRKHYNFIQYARYFWENFLTYWAGFKLYGYPKSKTIIEAIPSIILLVMPIIYWVSCKKEERKNKNAYYPIYIGMILAIFIQFFRAYYEFKNVSGYLGGYHARYYVCASVPIAMYFALMMNKINQKIQKQPQNKKVVTISFYVLIFEFLFLLTNTR